MKAVMQDGEPFEGWSRTISTMRYGKAGLLGVQQAICVEYDRLVVADLRRHLLVNLVNLLISSAISALHLMLAVSEVGQIDQQIFWIRSMGVLDTFQYF